MENKIKLIIKYAEEQGLYPNKTYDCTLSLDIHYQPDESVAQQRVSLYFSSYSEIMEFLAELAEAAKTVMEWWRNFGTKETKDEN